MRVLLQRVAEASVTIEGRVLKGVKSTGEKFSTYSPSDPWLVSDLL